MSELHNYLVTLSITVEVVATDKTMAGEIAVESAANGQYTDIFEHDSIAERIEKESQ